MAGLTDISVSNYTVLQYTTDSGTTWVDITNVNSIGDLTDEKTIVDVQEYGVSYLRKLVGTANAGTVDLTVNFNPADTSHVYLLASYKSGSPEMFRLVMYNTSAKTLGNYIQFNGFVGTNTISNSFDSSRTVVFSIAVDGALGALTPNL